MSRSDDPRQLDLFAPRPKPKRRKPMKPAPVTNVIKLPRRRCSARMPGKSATIAVLPPVRMLGEVIAAAQSMLDMPPTKWAQQRQRCAEVFADLIAGVPEAERQRAIDQFLDALDVELSRRLAKVAQGGGVA